MSRRGRDSAMTTATSFSKKVGRMLGLSLHGWENLMVGSLVFAAIAAAIVGVSTWAVVRLQRQELASSKIEFDTYKLETAKHIADANSAGEAAKADAAGANERAIEAQLALDKFRAARLPTPDQLDKLVSRLKSFAGTKFDIGHGLDDLEQMDFLWRLEPKLSEAGWVHLNWAGTGNVFVKPNWPGNYVYGRIGANNVSIELHPEHEKALKPAADALVAGLNEIGIVAAVKFFNNNSTNNDAVHILVGPKR